MDDSTRPVERKPCPWRLRIIISYLGSVAVLFAFWASQVVERHAQLDMASANKVHSSPILCACVWWKTSSSVESVDKGREGGRERTINPLRIVSKIWLEC